MPRYLLDSKLDEPKGGEPVLPGHGCFFWRSNENCHIRSHFTVAGSIPDCVIGIFQWHNPSGRTYGPGVDSASNRNEYQEHFLGVKAADA
jgi:hypothetical protein